MMTEDWRKVLKDNRYNRGKASQSEIADAFHELIGANLSREEFAEIAAGLSILTAEMFWEIIYGKDA